MTNEYTPSFEEVWKVYRELAVPVPGKKFEAFLAWQKIEKPLPSVDEMIEAIKIEKANYLYLKSKKEFAAPFKHFCRWLKYRCWEDVVEIKRPEAARNYYQPKPVVDKIETASIAEGFKELIKQKRTGQ